MQKFYTEEQVRKYFLKVKKWALEHGANPCEPMPQELIIDAEPIEMTVMAFRHSGENIMLTVTETHLPDIEIHPGIHTK